MAKMHWAMDHKVGFSAKSIETVVWEDAARAEGKTLAKFMRDVLNGYCYQKNPAAYNTPPLMARVPEKYLPMDYY